jgi:hypothetical protein
MSAQMWDPSRRCAQMLRYTRVAVFAFSPSSVRHVGCLLASRSVLCVCACCCGLVCWCRAGPCSWLLAKGADSAQQER